MLQLFNQQHCITAQTWQRDAFKQTGLIKMFVRSITVLHCHFNKVRTSPGTPNSK